MKKPQFVKSLLLSMTLVLAIAMPVSARSTMLPPLGVYGSTSLYADDDDHTYLGKITLNNYDADSIFNEYGTYGSKYSSESIFNEYGPYGGKYGSYSPFNEYTSSPPFVVDTSGYTLGRLSANRYIGRYSSPYGLTDPMDKFGF